VTTLINYLPRKGAPDSKNSKLAKIHQFPECSSSRRLEHPGIDDGPRVQYIHVPKAGGTSIQEAVAGWVKGTEGARLFKYDGNAARGSSTKCPAHYLLRCSQDIVDSVIV